LGQSGAVDVSINPSAVAGMNYGYFRATGSSKADSLLRYMRRIGRPFQQDARMYGPRPREVLLVCHVLNENPEDWEIGRAGAVTDVVHSLAARGWSPAVLALGASGCGTIGGSVWVGAKAGVSLTLALSSVTPFEVLIAPKGSPLLRIPVSHSQVALSGDKTDADRLLRLVVEGRAMDGVSLFCNRLLKGMGRSRRLVKRYLP
jgi:hypothetical protein